MTKTNPALPPSIEDELKCPVCRARLSREDDEHPCDPDREQRESAIRADEREKAIAEFKAKVVDHHGEFYGNVSNRHIKAVIEEMMEEAKR
jgi:hypothetical protein